MRNFLRAAALFLFVLSQGAKASQDPAEVIKVLKAPPGFKVSVYAKVPNARSLTMGPNGIVFVGNLSDGGVYALLPSADKTKAAQVLQIAKGLTMPNGVAYRDGFLYVAEVSRILRYDKIESRLRNPPKPVVIYDKLPSDQAHGWKFIAFGPDGKLYIPVGAPCNICLMPNATYGALHRMSPDGTGFELVASGIRNTVGFDWDPETKDLWFTDNGRDEMGDNIPPDELNHITKPAQNFGYPFCHAGTIKDPQFGGNHRCSEFEKPAALLDPHAAALGMRFYTGTLFPPEYRHNIFIAQHGSWNRSHKIGYRVVRAILERGQVKKIEPFVQGWLTASEKVMGRPVDVLQLADGSLLVSDDETGAVFRVSYSAPAK